MEDLKTKPARQAYPGILQRHPYAQPGESEKKDSTRRLTRRERGVLALAGRGLTNQDIADELGISSRTVKCILHHACIKLRAHNRGQALFKAVRQRYISIREVLSLDELVELLASLEPEVVDTIAKRIRLGRKLRLSSSHIESSPNPENATASAPVADNNLLSCASVRRTQKRAS